MEAQNVLLTHFSQRYPKMPDLQQHDAVTDESFGLLEDSSSSPSLTASRAPVAIAFDGASISIGSLWKMEKYTEAITQTVEAQESIETTVVLAAEVSDATLASPKKKAKKFKGTV
jgi:hypothetical protein